MIHRPPVPGFPAYTVDDRGVIHGRNGRPLKPGWHSTGYQSVVLRRDGKSHSKLVHRIVCESFYGPPGPGQECAHYDGDKQNNAPSNLRWCSHAENKRDSVRLREAPHGERHYAAKLSDDQTLLILFAGAGITHRQLAEVFSVCRNTIRSIRKGRRRPHAVQPAMVLNTNAVHPQEVSHGCER